MNVKKPNFQLQKLPKVRFSKSAKTTQANTAQVPPLKNSLRRSLHLVKTHRKQLAKATGIYAALYFIFVRAITKVDLNELRQTVNTIFGDGQETFTSRAVLAGTLFGESANLDASSGFYLTVIFFINSLAIIWLLRHIWAKKKTTVKDAYYFGMYPLVPVILIVLVIAIQAVPFMIASSVMQVVFTNQLAVNLLEKLGVVTIFVLGLTISMYWIAGSLVAIYAVTVPGTTPLMALRRAKKMLKGRRFMVARQMIIFGVITGVASLVLLLGIVYVAPDAAIVGVTLITIVLLPWTHLYLYGLYRDLLDE